MADHDRSVALTRNERRRMRRSTSAPDLRAEGDVIPDANEPLPDYDFPDIADPVNGEPLVGDLLQLEVPPHGGDEANLPALPLPQPSEIAPVNISLGNYGSSPEAANTSG